MKVNDYTRQHMCQRCMNTIIHWVVDAKHAGAPTREWVQLATITDKLTANHHLAVRGIPSEFIVTNEAVLLDTYESVLEEIRQQATQSHPEPSTRQSRPHHQAT